MRRIEKLMGVVLTLMPLMTLAGEMTATGVTLTPALYTFSIAWRMSEMV